MIAESLLQNGQFDIVKTGLFCYQEDTGAINTANEFKQMLNVPETFSTITYKDFLENVQRLDLDWEKREWTMLLWARYCGTILSEAVNEQLEMK